MKLLAVASVGLCVVDAFHSGGVYRPSPPGRAGTLACRNSALTYASSGSLRRCGLLPHAGGAAAAAERTSSGLRRRRPAELSALRMSYKPDEDWEGASQRERVLVAAQEVLSRPHVAGGLAVALACAAAAVSASGGHLGDIEWLGPYSDRLAELAIAYNPVHLLQLAVTAIQSQGTMGYLYFGILYVVAEVLAIPALPLTASSGYLFGLQGGTAVVISAATLAAGISFMLGRTFLRKWVEELLGDNPKFKAIDSAIGKQGFKIILLLRLSPIFPFAISNYLYGITSVNFWEYLSASMLGFLPGTVAYVYGGGQVGNLLGQGDGAALPWYVYAVGLAVAAASIKFVGDVATKAVEEIEPGLAGDEQEWD